MACWKSLIFYFVYSIGIENLMSFSYLFFVVKVESPCCLHSE
jgi:hypothetical protein